MDGTHKNIFGSSQQRHRNEKNTMANLSLLARDYIKKPLKKKCHWCEGKGTLEGVYIMNQKCEMRRLKPGEKIKCSACSGKGWHTHGQNN